MSKSTNVFWAIGGIALVVLCTWRYGVVKSQGISHGLIISDSSLSTEEPCNCLSNLTEEALANPILSKESTLTITATGDEETANESIVVTTINAPFQQGIFSNPKKVAQLREQQISKVVAQCQEQKRTNASPIYQAIKNGVYRLRSLGCGQLTPCIMYVQSDLEERSEPAIRKALTSTVPVTGLPEPINNEGISLYFRGISQTFGVKTAKVGGLQSFTSIRDAQKTERIYEVWRSLFTKPENLHFDPYCTKR
jgi:hypothetical protein